MKKVLIFCSFLFLAIMIIGILPVNGEERIYDNVIRLHVIARSNSKEDQALKLCVRDSVLAQTEALLAEARSREEAEEWIKTWEERTEA